MGIVIAGQCHCGNLSSQLQMPEGLCSLTLYGCSCHYCRLHSCVWLGEPARQLSLSAEAADQCGWYATGQLAPHYLFCRHCAVVVATVSHFGDGWYGIVNAQTLLLPALPQDYLPFRPESLTDEQRLALRRRRWVGQVLFAGDLSPPRLAASSAIAS